MENIVRHISAKFDVAVQLIDIIPPPDPNPALCGALGPPTPKGRPPGLRKSKAPDRNKDRETNPYLAAEPAEGVASVRVELDAIHTRYVLSTSHLFFQASLGEYGRLAVREEFNRIIASENFLGELDGLVRRVQLILGVREEDLRTTSSQSRRSAAAGGVPRRGKKSPSRAFVREVKTLLDQYNGHEVDCAAYAVGHSLSTHGEKYDFCSDCGLEMSINADTSELTCPGCGAVRELIGTVFDDAQFYNQEGQKAKSGSFNPNRHFRFWMEHILAREPEEELGDKDDPDNLCGEKALRGIQTIVTRDHKILRLLSVDDIRAMLKELGLTDLNKNVPLLMRRLTGVGPPSLSEMICQRVEKLFSKAIDVGEQVRPSARSNRNYYPYYIYKILDSILGDDDHENRRVLYYIYMQGQDTLDKNDREWEDICIELPEIEWVATKRTNAYKYRPR